ncbi:class I SAM-dependent methyltransferase [Allokutzneria albata]|uniref:Methyltransferase domain-containing protein n=1 Tax=Allokutzneria albata TaxID=211114 RepID=A0A1G9TS29_ALLAB|nr:class I SAM-dependent methyltransferase [Allokutzneria albata]SDM49975.1 Methyltransferase domain-containing protein [Allokutzneria albata]
MTATVDPSNSDQIAAWDGDQGAFWTKHAGRFNDGVAAYRDHFFSAAAIEPDAAVLDIGCGSGQSTRDAARQAKDGSALGVDLSARMLDLARELAEREDVPNATFLQADAQIHPFTEGGFDVVISRHGTMFFGDPEAAFANIARAVRPGGRLALLTWQPARRNEWMSTFRTIFSAGREQPTPAPRAGSLTDPDLTRELLTSAGFTAVELHPVSEPMYFGRDVEDALEFIVDQFGWMTRDLSPEDRSRVVDEVRADMRSHRTEHGVFYGSAAWIIQARRP